MCSVRAAISRRRASTCQPLAQMGVIKGMRAGSSGVEDRVVGGSKRVHVCLRFVVLRHFDLDIGALRVGARPTGRREKAPAAETVVASHGGRAIMSIARA